MPKLRLVARVCYLLWGVAALVVSVFLITARGGHPPAIILLPPTVAIWLIGQLTLWGSFYLIERGQARSRAAPPSWWLAVVGCIVVFTLGLIFVIRIWLDRDQGWTAWNLILLAIWVPHAVCLPGLLLRRRWGATMAAVLAAGWATLMAVQIVDHLIRGSRVDAGELLFALAIVAAFGLLAWRLMRFRP